MERVQTTNGIHSNEDDHDAADESPSNGPSNGELAAQPEVDQSYTSVPDHSTTSEPSDIVEDIAPAEVKQDYLGIT